jgi:ABC-type lipoprotein export system ATPase subunit
MKIEFKNVTKKYQLDGLTTITPVRDIILDISSGEFIIIIGRSGSGKTTLLNLAAGLLKPTSGEVLVDDVKISAMTEDQLSLLRSQKIGFIFQFPSLLPSLTIMENVVVPTAFGLKPNKQDICNRANDLLNTVGLAERKGVYPKQLSAEEQKRAVIARSLINRPEVILADEPTSDLDVQTEQEIMALLREIYHSGVTFIMVTHSLELILYATRAFKMENGSLFPLEKNIARMPSFTG